MTGTREPVVFTLDGERITGQAGDTLAAALLRAGTTTFTRSIKYHRPRGPFCLAGSCGQCLVRVDGVPSLPACRIDVKEGMACERQNGPLGLVDSDLFRAVDFLFHGGLDHHHLMIQSRLLGKVTLEVARRLAGLGTLPDRPQPPLAGGSRAVPLVIVGAGPAGLSAARAALEAGRAPGATGEVRVLVLERDGTPGGAARLGLASAVGGPALTAEAAALAGTPGVELLTRAEVIGLYADDGPLGEALLAVRHGGRLIIVRARRVIVATGGTSQPLPFPGVDRPGVHAARGLLDLHRRSGVLAGAAPHRLAVVGEGSELVGCARALRDAGYQLAAVVDASEAGPPGAPRAPESPDLPLLRGAPVRARGNPVAELQISVNGKLTKIRCDAIAVALPPAPLHDLASSAGADAAWDAGQGGFPLRAGPDGRTSVGWLFAAGTAAGRGGGEAGSSGTAAGRAAGGEAQALAAAAVAGGAPEGGSQFVSQVNDGAQV